MEKLIHGAKEHGLVLFLGAGTSMIAPSSLPGWYKFNDLVLEGLTRRLVEYTNREWLGSEILEEVLNRRNKTQYLAPDYQAQLMTEQCGESYFRVLQVLDVDETNPVHQDIAHLAKSGHLAAVVTTNFDRLVERALTQAGIDHRVYFDVAGFQALQQTLTDPQAPLLVVKVHGSVESPESMVDTLQQRLIGRPEELEQALTTLLQRHHWLIMGWSGADLDYDPNYLGFRAAAENGAGLTYLSRAGSPLRQSIAELIAAYGPKGSVIESELPGWFHTLAGELGTPVRPLEDLPAPVDRVPALRERVADWAKSIGDMSVLNILIALLQSCGQDEAAFQLLRRNWKTFRVPADCSGRSYAQYCYNYGKALMEAGSIYNPIRLEADMNNMLEWKDHADRNAYEFLARAVDNGMPEALPDFSVLLALRGECDKAVEQFERILTAALDQGHYRTLRDTCAAAGIIFDMLGAWTDGLRWLDNGYHLTVRYGDEPHRSLICAHLGRFLAYKRRFDEAAAHLAEGEKIAERLDLKVIQTMLQAAHGAMRCEQGQYAEAVPLLVGAYSRFQALGRVPAAVRTALDLVLAACYSGEDALLNQTLDYLDETATTVIFGYRPHYYLTYAEVLIYVQQFDGAQDLIDRARKDGTLMENPWVALKADQLQTGLNSLRAGKD